MVRIAAVSYLNTFPFVYGIRKSGFIKDYKLRLEVPSVCADSIRDGQSDIGLVPVGALPGLPEVSIITDYCIGADGPVKTVLLLSMVPIEEIRQIHLDFDSRTSVELVRILAKFYWQIKPGWIPFKTSVLPDPSQHPSVVAIGDKTFHLRKQYRYIYDLAETWKLFTGSPFVFAVWVSQKGVDPVLIGQLNRALAYGVSNKIASLEYFKDQLPSCDDCLDYLEKNISYPLTEEKRQGMARFLELMK
jgi:chorismate dehydratase